MKICYIADAANIATQEWVNYFARKGHDIHLISSSPREGYLDGVQLHQLTVPLPQKFWVVLRSINALTRIIKVRRLVKRIKPDIIHAHFITTNGFLGATSGFHPLVLTAWGSDILLLPKQSFYWRFLVKYALKRADLVTCNSEVLRRGLVGLGVAPTKIRIIYNGIDTQKFKPQPGKEFRTRLGLQGVPVVISTRKLRPIYNVEMLVKAVPLILERMPQVSFIIAGYGERKEYLEGLAASLGVSENVRFVGWITHDELPAYLTSSDIYVSTSLSDGTSVSLQEAMACELAPVVTDLPANREWIKDGGNGFIVPINNPQALAEKIIYLIENKEIGQRFGKASRKTIKERAEYKEEMSKMGKLYESLVK